MGDAAWYPTGLSGGGTALAIVGAGELGKTDDHAAFNQLYLRDSKKIALPDYTG